MDAYLEQTQYAANCLITAITHERQELEKLYEQLERKQTTNGLWSTFMPIALLGMSAIAGPLILPAAPLALVAKKALLAKDVKNLKQEILDSSDRLQAQTEAYNALSASLLQIAKQSISVKYGGLEACPEGRSIGNEKLKNVIWQGRNQSIHYEEPKLRKSITECFSTLEADFGPPFCLASPPQTSRAMNIVALLDWTSYEKYEADLTALMT